MNHYERLGVDMGADFTALKKAYYRKVKLCHPDLFNNSRAKEEEFKLLVNAFDILSDPLRRAAYDRELDIPEKDVYAAAHEAASANMDSIMDSPADDILEELVVGNNPPSESTLATLLSDLEHTRVFMTFREAENLYFAGRARDALPLFLTAVSFSPSNIIYRVYLARAFGMLGSYSKAALHYRAALKIGMRRMPPQNLMKVAAELDSLNARRFPLWHRFLSFFKEKKSASVAADADTMIGETNRAIAGIITERRKKRREEDVPKLNK